MTVFCAVYIIAFIAKGLIVLEVLQIGELSLGKQDTRDWTGQPHGIAPTGFPFVRFFASMRGQY